MSGLFDIIGQLSTSTTDNWSDIEEKDYVSFMVNRNFSLFVDTVMLANEMNKIHTIPKKWQYDFYRLAVQPKKKRFAKWHKPEKDETVELIMNTYKVNRQRAKSIYNLLNEESINTLRTLTNCGGK
jgi:hypothetical protein